MKSFSTYRPVSAKAAAAAEAKESAINKGLIEPDGRIQRGRLAHCSRPPSSRCRLARKIRVQGPQMTTEDPAPPLGDAAEILAGVSTATLTTVLLKRGLRNV